MRKTIYKRFCIWEFDKEERWLNEMAAIGLSLVSVGFCRYEFEEALPGEYTVRLQLLEHGCNHPESVKYIEFLEETGAEQVGSYGRWIYFRKRAADGAFELFSDTSSRFRQITQVLLLILFLGALNLYLGAYNLLYYYFHRIPINLLGMVSLLLAAVCMAGSIPILRKRQELKKQLTLFE